MMVHLFCYFLFIYRSPQNYDGTGSNVCFKRTAQRERNSQVSAFEPMGKYEDINMHYFDSQNINCQKLGFKNQDNSKLSAIRTEIRKLHNSIESANEYLCQDTLVIKTSQEAK